MKLYQLLLSAALLGASLAATARDLEADTTQTVTLSDVEVLGTRATSKMPIAFTTMTKAQLNAVNHGQDIPFLLSTTPGVLTTSDAGAGVGYSSIRVRGTDATRINVTANGIPMNDAESHSVFWVNTPDLASSLQDVQVQRGVGTSTNGAGAFGASINLRTQLFSTTPFAVFSGSYGSFTTHKETVSVGTGLLHDRWALEARLSNIGSNGYRDRATSDLKSFFVQGGWFDGSTSVRLIAFGGQEETYHAWDGISRDMLVTNRTYNPNGEIKRDGKVVDFYEDQKDIYRQMNYQALCEHTFSPEWQLNVGLHYTDGYGYYQEYKNARTLVEYGLTPFTTTTIADDGTVSTSTVKKSSLVRRKVLDSGFGGAVFSLRYTGERLSATLGGGANRYINNHYGRVMWVENYLGELDPSHEYYRNKGRKTDFNIYLRGNYTLWHGLSAYADLQLRHIAYTIKGVNDKWDWTANPERMQLLDVDEKFNFFNPKAGLNWQITPKHRIYASLGVAHKEPTRNNYNDGPLLVHPRAERLIDWELGYTYNGGRLTAGVNLYYMNYKDQLVLNGKLNEIGEPMSENVPHSYRCGIELMAGFQLTSWLRWDVNATLSRNRIKDYVGYVSDYEADTWDEMWSQDGKPSQTAIECGNTTIAFSPSVIANSVFALNYKGFTAQFQSQYVSRQYLDNFQNRDDSLDPYFVSHLHLDYTFTLPRLKNITVGVSIYNLFNEKYETNGYSQTAALYKNGSKANGYTLSSDPRFYPMAGTNLLAHLRLNF
ncbi:MAG: TonB-dependent receptor [Muribaculaceae bacterium]|nr:TonB-dependent receptor [Muribaculaceae bacterium]